MMIIERVLFPLMYLGLEAGKRVLGEEVELRPLAVDKGANVSIPCGTDPEAPTNVQWIHKGSRTHHEILTDGSLLLKQVGVEDAGTYECIVDNETSFLDRINLTVKTEPPALANVTVHASTILALILWQVAGDGGYPIQDFTAQYRSATPPNGSLELEPWRPISPNHISPNSRQIDVYHLDVNASYWFRVWANNHLGSGPPVQVLATTLYTDQEAELYKHFLAGAEQFDPRAWLAAVCIVLGTLLILAAATAAALARDCRRDNENKEEHDIMELVPNIILNPGFIAHDPRPKSLPTFAATIITCTDRPSGIPRKV